MPITNPRVSRRAFLAPLYADPGYPDGGLDKASAILRRLCEDIEERRPADLSALYTLTAAATEEFNALQAEFEEAGGDFDTVAREEICEEFAVIAEAYGFADADAEKLTAARDW